MWGKNAKKSRDTATLTKPKVLTTRNPAHSGLSEERILSHVAHILPSVL